MPKNWGYSIIVLMEEDNQSVSATPAQITKNTGKRIIDGGTAGGLLIPFSSRILLAPSIQILFSVQNIFQELDFAKPRIRLITLNSCLLALPLIVINNVPMPLKR